MGLKHYVALGDSLTAGVGDTVDGIETRGWADRFAEALRPAKFTNLAKRGATTNQILALQVGAALALDPDMLSLLAGGNDMRQPDWNPEHTRLNLRAILYPFAERGTALVTCTMVDIFAAMPSAARASSANLREKLHATNQIMREVSREFGALCIDLQNEPELLNLRQTLSRDMIHPNMLGYQRIAQLAVAQVMEMALRRA
jgi:lysophospholipase L1-like esterase